MTHRKLLAIAAALALAGTTTACDPDKLTDINRNPNSPEDAPPGPLFTSAARVSAARWLGGGYDLRGAALLSQHLAQVQYPDEDAYSRLTGGATTGYFDAPYYTELEDLQKVILKGEALDEPGLYGPALVLRTWGFGFLTDTWGDIPYSEALGADDGGTLSPAYDSQQSVYDDFFVVLNRAADDMGGSVEVTLSNADPIYGGSMSAWRKFANSLRARHALRIVNVNPTKASTELAAAFTDPGGVFASNADNAVLHWPGDGIYNNPWSDNFQTRDDHRMSDRLMNIMTDTVTDRAIDPRTPIYAMETSDTTDAPGTFRGMPNALTHSGASAYFNISSRPGAAFYPGQTTYGFFGGQGKSFPSFMMTYAEVAFIRAEAAERGLGGLTAGQAAGFYQAGIRASMEQWGVPEAEIVAYLARPEVIYLGGVAGQRQIATQKWIALYTDGGQAWAEWRRTCVPFTVKPGPAAIINTHPRRLQYSITEVSVNGASVDAAVGQQGPDEFTTRMYWDKQPNAAPTFQAGCGAR
jgi:hypothetical protein